MPQKNHESSELVRLREKRDEAERKREQAEHNLQRIENRKKYLDDGNGRNARIASASGPVRWRAWCRNLKV